MAFPFHTVYRGRGDGDLGWRGAEGVPDGAPHPNVRDDPGSPSPGGRDAVPLEEPSDADEAG